MLNDTVSRVVYSIQTNTSSILKRVHCDALIYLAGKIDVSH